MDDARTTNVGVVTTYLTETTGIWPRISGQYRLFGGWPDFGMDSPVSSAALAVVVHVLTVAMTKDGTPRR